MIIPNSLNDNYNNSLPYYTILKEDVDQTLINFCSKNDYLYMSRIKKINSLAEKVESGRYSSWEEIDDIFACSIIIPTLSLEDSVVSELIRYFSFHEKKMRGETNKSPLEFRFDSTRLICKLNKSGGSDKLNNLLFEIQIKSIFEYAWSKTTHSLTYKTDKPRWQRLRLSSQLKAIVEQIDSLLIGFEETSTFISKSKHSQTEVIIYICNYLEEEIFEKINNFPSELKPKDFNRFSENFYSLIRSTKKFGKKKYAKSEIEIFQQIMITINDEIRRMEYIPKSISLLQLFIGILVDTNIITNDRRKYSIFITDELEMNFPKVKELVDNRFTLN